MAADASRESDDEWAARVTRAVHRGSRDALGELYDRSADDLARFVRRTTRRDDSFALDCLQETFVRLAARPPIVDSHGALLAWLRRTALNAARNAIVAEMRRARRESALPRSRADGGARDRRDGDEPVAELLARLEEREAELLRLRHVEGMRVAAIARALGATPRAIESALRRVLERLRAGGAA